MYHLVHETTIANFDKIVDSNVLLIASKTKLLNVSFQGSKNRKLATDPTESLKDRAFHERFDEVDGVYFRLHATNDPIKLSYNGDCIMVLNFNILKNYKFVINTEENFGFCLERDGVIGYSPYSGDLGLSISKWDNLHYLNKMQFDPSRSEVVVLSDIPLTNALLTAFITKRTLSKNLEQKLITNGHLYYVLN
ncbi:hypothetical protein [Epiphyas postvittana nucleopolyhedrovirus]|uniref:Uncharacterized protein n=1 Tax=Epiphyas postvittana nucleopolyhedrovirus TaxID=70600 RepID=Q91GF3_NPVEP|nr:hypothetical protein [Epiphyas postvittana nucleopolyhedrovirus]AAK85665.1 unknown [Epiphyas postvittana nucleopolyhedrovirus]